MKTSEFHFDLPCELIAQEPMEDRSMARMMVVHRESGQFEHKHVRDLPGYLKAGDLLIVNDTRVIPARVFGRRTDTGGRVELLLVEKMEAGETSPPSKHVEYWDCLYRASGRPRVGLTLLFGCGEMTAEVVSIGETGRVRVRLTADNRILDVLEQVGFAPVPPYIHRPKEQTHVTANDRQSYQTVYAVKPGAVAAPTAGLHFTPELLKTLDDKGVGRAAVTLHVGPGTFKPVKTDLVENHKMESEVYEIGDEAAKLFRHTRRNGGRVIVAGSTTVRTLETVVRERGEVEACSGRTSLFIYPPYSFKTLDLMLTNFHLPESSLIIMVCALAGKELVMKAYSEAIERKYRFYSYGDCMLII